MLFVPLVCQAKCLVAGGLEMGVSGCSVVCSIGLSRYIFCKRIGNVGFWM